MPSGNEAPKPRAWRRWIRRALLTGLGLAVLFSALWLTGFPQRFAASALLSSQIGGTSSVSSISLGNPLVVQGLTLASGAATLYGPVAQVDRLEAAYHLSPDEGRYIPSLDLTGVQLSLEQGDSGSNFQYLLDRFSQPSDGGDVTPWIPEQINLDTLGLAVHFPSFSIQAENLKAHAEMPDGQSGIARFGAPDTAVVWSSAVGGGGEQRTSGNISLEATWNPDGASMDAEVTLGELARVTGTFSSTQKDGLRSYALSIPDASLKDPLWSALANDLSPIPTRFDSLALKDSAVKFHMPATGPVIDEARVDAALSGVQVGPPDAPYYRGPLHLALHGNYGDKTEVAGTVTLREGLALDASFALAPEGLDGTFEWKSWPREDLIALVPPDYSGVLSTLEPLTRLGAKGSLSQRPDVFKVDATLAAEFGGKTSMAIPLSLAWTTETGASTLALSLEAALGESRLKSTTTVPEGGAARVENLLTNVSLNAWTALLLGKEIAPGLAASLSGRADLALPSGKPLEIALDLSSAGLGYGSLSLPAETPVTLAGTMNYDTTSGVLAGAGLKLAQEGTADLAISKWSVDLSKAALNAALDGTLSLDAIGQIFALPDLHGAAALKGNLSVGPGGTHFDGVTATSEDLGYGETAVPYGSQLTLTGSLAYDTANSALRLAPIQGTIGDGTQCSLAALTFHFSNDSRPLTVNFDDLNLVSDLSILKVKNLITSATGGHASISSKALVWDGKTFSGLTNWELRADSLDLPEKMGAFTNLVHTGKYDPGSGEAGGGPLSVGPFTIYEIPFGTATTELKVTPESVSCTPFETAFLGGTLTLDAELKYREANYPATIDAQGKDLDLEQFTQTFKPPDVVMTGKVNGNADLVISAEGLVDLNVDLTASDHLTLNQAAVRQILMSQYVNDAVGSKAIQKVIESVIGKDDQRSFEKAALTLHFEGGLIVGEARLESKNLDVTVDIKAEPEAILQAIQSAAEETP